MERKNIYIAIVIVVLLVVAITWSNRRKGEALPNIPSGVRGSVFPKYLRISLEPHITRKNTNAPLHLMEVHVYDIKGNEVANGAPVTSSGTQNEKYPWKNLTDGDIKSSAMATSNDVPWMQIELPGTSHISKVVIYNTQPGFGITQPGKDFVGSLVQLLAPDNMPIKTWIINEYNPTKYELDV